MDTSSKKQRSILAAVATRPTVADGKFVIFKQPTLVPFRAKLVQVEDNAATAAESTVVRYNA